MNATETVAPRALGIASPVSEVDEVDLLVENGATEFYCGVAPSAWAAHYGASWLNRRSRGKANLPSIEHVAALTERAHEYNVPVRVTLNAPFYTGEQLDDVVSLAGELKGAGADGLIVSERRADPRASRPWRGGRHHPQQHGRRAQQRRVRLSFMSSA